MYTFLYGMSLTDLQALQTSVLSAYNRLMSGSTVTVFADFNGARMEYSRASTSDLLSYLNAIGAAIARLTGNSIQGGSRPLGFVF